jgi:diaminohydroxyphosphoribosylaminopyrimidine deaminase / 5-amino-6-(5-phosphoribosylamino)uracil reductase
MVGAVLVQHERVLAEGWHGEFGGPHAEVNCLNAFGNGSVPSDATLYVNLEPCAHHGKTPPCVDLLIHRGVKRLVVGCMDPNPSTQGKGIARAREAGMEVITDVLQAECRWLNRRFIHSFEKERPYVLLKWARTSDGFIDDHGRAARISSPTTDVLVHRWRSEEQAILVGSRTVVNDDPSLTVRHVAGKNPLRVVLDRANRSPMGSAVFSGETRTLLFTNHRREDLRSDQIVLPNEADPLDTILTELHARHVRSVLVEGGAELLGHFLAHGLWNEARVITGTSAFGSGTRAPVLNTSAVRSYTSGPDRIDHYYNGEQPPSA